MPRMSALVVEAVEPGDPMIELLVDLGDRSRRTLGFMPRAAYWDAADHRRLIAAKRDGQAVGYALIRLPRNNQVALVHLCVAEDARGHGVAHALVDFIQDRYGDRWGIKAKCRDDYGLSSMWMKLGFEARATAVGRGKDQSPMTVWWLDHGHPDLFSFLVEPEIDEDEPDLLEAALDINILMDLHIRRDQPNAVRSRVLEADHLVGRLRLVVTEGIDHDLARHPVDQRQRLQAAADHYSHRSAAKEQVEKLFAAMEAASETPLTEQDKGDLWQIAAAVAAGIGVLLTWDDGLRARFARLREVVPALGEFRVYDPDHLITHLDELARAWAYQPARLQGSEYDQVRAGADQESDLMRFLDQPGGERRGEFRDALRRLAREQVPPWLIRSATEPTEPPVACYATRLTGEILQVPLLRLTAHPLSETLARQLLWMLRQDALDQHASVIDISDPHLSGALVRAAAAEAFHRSGDHWYGWVISVCGSAQQITEAANHARDLANLGSGPLLRSHLAPRAAAEIERALWPAKLTDSELLHYIVPIQPRWSSDLLGYPVQLTSRRIELALGREQVYYRAADRLVVAPARILWRVSKGRHNTSLIIGTSALDDIQVGAPEVLHAAFSQYGVFELADLEGDGKDRSIAEAVLFSDTELFDAPINDRQYDALKSRWGGPKNFMSPRRIKPELFQVIYNAGTGRG
jgi:GNAT superfamily N-acetyltransferase